MLRAFVLSFVFSLLLVAGCEKPPSSEGLRQVWTEQLLKFGYSRTDNVAFGAGDNMGGFERRSENEFYSPEESVRVVFKAVEIESNPSDLYSYSGVVRYERESPNSKATGATYYLYGRRTKTWIRKEEGVIGGAE